MSAESRPMYTDGRTLYKDARRIQQQYWDKAGEERIDPHTFGGNAGLYLHQVVREDSHFQRKAVEERIKDTGKRLTRMYRLGEAGVYVGVRVTKLITGSLLHDGVKKLASDNNQNRTGRYTRPFDP